MIQVTSGRARGNALKLCCGDLSWILGTISSPKRRPGIGRGCPGQGESPPLEVFRMSGCGTWGHGLVANVVVLADGWTR